jgi:hypothetical protein
LGQCGANELFGGAGRWSGRLSVHYFRRDQ